MGLSTLHDIEQAIQKLEPGALGELGRWFAQHYSQLFDKRIESDLAAGRLDGAIRRGLGVVKRTPGERPLREDWAEHRKKERGLEERHVRQGIRASPPAG